jgi:Ca-activated chloride channel family protein
MRFGSPTYLWILLAVPVFAALLALLFYRRRRALALIGDLPLLERLTGSVSIEKRIIKSALLVLASIFLILALARPQWGARMETVTRRGIDVVVAVDTFLSMMAEDIKPNRLSQARAAILSLMDLLQGDRIGLVALSGTAYVACPLTLDYAAAAMFVDVLDPDLIPVPGTGIAAALRAAIGAFPEQERRHKVIILITDGEDHEGDVEAAAREAADQGIIVYTVGVGSTSGEPIPLRDAHGAVVGYKEDKEHRKVTSRLGESALESIASTTRGKYFRSTTEGIELRSIYDEIAAMDQKTLSSRIQTAFEERYLLPLGAALFLLLLEAAIGDRRSAPAVLEGAARRKEAA